MSTDTPAERKTAFDFVAKKAGLNLSREQEEKITDGARQAYEKYSG